MADNIKPFKIGCCANPYPTAYDETLSYYEEVCKIAAKLNEIINAQNNLQASFEQIVDWVTTQLKTYSIEQLQEWLDDGTFANIINKDLLGSLSDDVENLTGLYNSLNAQVSKLKGISPIPVDNISKMTDTNSIYVLTTDGYWYYYDNGWKKGGVYQSQGIDFNKLYKNSPKKYSYSTDSDGVVSGYYNSSGNLMQSNSNSCLEVKIYDDTGYFKFDANKELSAAPFALIKYKDGSVQPFNKIHLVTFSLSNADSLLLNFFKDTDGSEYVDFFEVEYRTPVSNINAFLFNQNKILTLDNMPIENGYYNNKGIKQYAYNHRCAKVYIAGAKFKISYSGAILGSSLSYVIFEKDGNFTTLNETVSDYVISGYEYMYLNFFNGEEDYVENFNVTDYNADTIDLYNNFLYRPFNFTNKKLLFVGDSITKGFTNGSTVTPNSYPKLFSDYFSATFKNNAVGGALYTSGYNDILTLKGQLEQSSNDFDYVFISGGINDWQLGVPIDEFKESVKDTINYALENFKEVIVITPIRAFRPSMQAIKPANDYINTLTEICMELNVNIVQGHLFNFPYNDDDEFIEKCYGDRIHPSELGYKIYTNGLITALV